MYVITDNPRLAKGLDDAPLVIPRNGKLTALCAVLPLQFLAYELALLRGRARRRGSPRRVRSARAQASTRTSRGTSPSPSPSSNTCTGTARRCRCSGTPQAHHGNS